MIEDVFAKWRGADRWIETDAIVHSCESVADGIYDDGPPSTRLVFYYRDHVSSIQSGEFIVDSLTSLYKLRPDDTFRLRFNPQKPQQIYCSEAASLFSQARLTFWIGVPTVLIIVTVILVLRLLQFHHLVGS